MIVYVMRHARIPFGEGLPKVEERHITPQGRRWAEAIVAAAKRELGFDPDAVVSSPLLRAMETAQVVAKALGKESKLSDDDCLLPEGEPKAVYAMLRRLNRVGSVLLVSTQPLIDNLIADLIGGPSKVGLYLGSIACFQCKSLPGPGKGELVWLLPPSELFDGKRWPP
ncbi:MAG: histidine phosphatase family protein [Nitrososphaerota archaeon]|nr:histidine phosphatase family protein [Nitrososphaerota archaeon]MDG6937797.1 histidine phosphatase family protein [Nitrososphaerota archaeon]MDG6953020.1 histidine phosphatase family protein [Nitrososphaerota archaeon]MDG6956982.1 histidine phosphatase family protein [Nitrososphaerota archaeon]MDG6969190.1 histidine phosphatase family protein [Nitrososphaerota archaeon]